jgi:hypothetical protein
MPHAALATMPHATMPIPSPHTGVGKLLICLAKLPLFLLFLI